MGMGRLGTAGLILLLVGAPPEGASAQELLDLFVSSRNTDSVKRFDGRTGEFLGDFVASGAGGLSATQEVGFGPNGNLFVSGRGNTSILEYDGDTGEFVGPFTSGYALDNPTKMTFSPDGHLYVSQWGEEQSTVVRFDAGTGAFVGEATRVPLNMGMQHVWDSEGRMYVASYGSKDVKRFDSDGDLLDVFISPEHLQSAVNLWFGTDGHLFVVDWEAGAVQRYDGATGAYIDAFITGLSKTEGFAFGPNGMLYLTDWQLNKIHRFDPTSGEALGVFTEAGGMMQPNGLVFGPKPKG